MPKSALKGFPSISDSISDGSFPRCHVFLFDCTLALALLSSQYPTPLILRCFDFLPLPLKTYVKECFFGLVGQFFTFPGSIDFGL